MLIPQHTRSVCGPSSGALPYPRSGESFIQGYFTDTRSGPNLTLHLQYRKPETVIAVLALVLVCIHTDNNACVLVSCT